jgi:hypothetical protein
MIFDKIRSSADGMMYFDKYKSYYHVIYSVLTMLAFAVVAWYFDFYSYYYVALGLFVIVLFAYMVLKTAWQVIIGVTDYDKNNQNPHI